jgi:large subunit ribosomal protein L4
MSFSPLSSADAASKLKVDLIENGIGTQALHETVVAYQANRRAGTHSTKTKATVAGSGKKPWRQKGTGNARAGYKSSPVWSGGGVVFGPHPRDYSKKTNKNVKQLALKKAISSRVNAGEVYLIDPITLAKPKTRDLVAQLKDGGLDKKTTALLVIENPDQNLYLASRNHPHLITVTGDAVNAEQLLLCDKIFITEGALGKLSARLQK